MFQNTDIFESPCIETRRFKNCCVLYTEIFESPCIETRRLEYMKSLPYKTSMFQYMEIFESRCIEIQKSPCFNHADPVENFWIRILQKGSDPDPQPCPCYSLYVTYYFMVQPITGR